MSPFFNSRNHSATTYTTHTSKRATVRSLGSLVRSLDNSDLSHVTPVGEVVIASAHITVLPRLRDAETRRVAGGWGVVQLILKWFLLICVTSLV